MPAHGRHYYDACSITTMRAGDAARRHIAGDQGCRQAGDAGVSAFSLGAAQDISLHFTAARMPGMLATSAHKDIAVISGMMPGRDGEPRSRRRACLMIMR